MVHALPGGRMGCLDQVHYLLFIKYLCDTIFSNNCSLVSGIYSHHITASKRFSKILNR